MDNYNYTYNNNNPVNSKEFNNQQNINKQNNIEKPTKGYIFLAIIAGILTLIPVSSLILNLISSKIPNIEISDSFFIGSFYAVKVIGFLIYFLALKKTTKAKIILSIIAGVFLLLSGLTYISMDNMDNRGIDGIGEALAIAMILKINLGIYYILTFIVFILYSKSFLLKKKVIISIVVSIIVIVLLVVTIKVFYNYVLVGKVSKDIPTVNDFKNELIERGLYVEENQLFGVDDKGDNIHQLSFSDNSGEQYPSYVYYGYKTINENKPESYEYYNYKKHCDYYEWIIYYTNGKIYAAIGELDDSQLFQNYYSLRLSTDSNILSEDEEIYTYNWEKNYYEKIDIEKDGVAIDDLRYYYENGRHIIVDVLEKFSISLFHSYEIIDKIDSNTLDYYANYTY